MGGPWPTFALAVVAALAVGSAAAVLGLGWLDFRALATAAVLEVLQVAAGSGIAGGRRQAAEIREEAGVSLNAVRWALYHAPAVTPADRVVLICLADHASHHGAGNHPSPAVVARKLGMGVDAVEHALVRLAETGAVVLVPGGPRPAVAGLNLEVRR